MQISDTRIILRPVEPEDLDTLYLLENATSRAEGGFATAPASRFELSRYIESYSADIFAEKQLRLMIVARDSGRTVGAIDISDFDARNRRGFVGIAVIEDERRKGYGRAALEVLCGYAADVLGMHQLDAQIAYDNEASRALFGACGFRTCGRLRSWLRRGSSYADALLYQRIFA